MEIVAFICFFILVAAWFVAPNGVREEQPVVVKATEVIAVP